jgi:hypothetical protein
LGDIIFQNYLQIEVKYEIKKKFEGLYFPSIFQVHFFTEGQLEKIAEKINLYSSYINQIKPMYCKVYGTQKFLGMCVMGSLIPPSNVRDLWIHLLGKDLVKGTVQKDV